MKISIHRLNVNYRHKPVLRDINMEFPENSLTAIVGPSGSGKSTLLMSVNRLLDAIPHARWEGQIDIKLESGETIDVFRLPEAKLPDLRRRVGLVFQHPNVLPTSIFGNLAFPLRLMGLPREQMEEKIRLGLERVFLWEEVKDRLQSPAEELSGGQQHRLCLARTLVMEPEVILLDEPTSFLDESLAQRIESLLLHIKEKQTLIVVSHYLDQVRRLSDRVYRLV
jgi:phosphate transport system ATP-binding protein